MAIGLHRSIAAVAALLALAASAAQAQDWPNKPIRFVVPFAPGGATDVVARIIGERLSTRLGQPVAIDNRPGAGGNIGAAVVAKSAADGYTMFVAGSPGFTNAAALTKDPGFDVERDFVAVAMIATQSVLLAVSPSLPVSNVQEFVAYAKARPGQLSYGTPGIGTPHHLAMEVMKLAAGLDVVHVPYRGGAPAVQDLLAGQIPVVWGSYTIVGPHQKSGKIKILGNSSKRPMSLAPEIKSVADQGFPDFDVEIWFGLMAPAGTPAAAVDRMSREVHAVVDMEDIKQRLLPTGSDPPPRLTPVQFQAVVKRDVVRWSEVVRKAGIKPE